MKYFAYGSNMDPARMRDRTINYSVREHAVLSRYSLQFNKIADANSEEGRANIVPDAEDSVEGAFYDIEPSDITKLDRYEGYPAHYDKINVSVRLDDGSEIEALTYIAQPDKVRNGLRPRREYLEHLLAARDILSDRYYQRLESRPTLDE